MKKSSCKKQEKNRQQTLKKLNKSKYAKDSLVLKLIGLIEQSIDNEGKIPTRVDYAQKREIDRSALQSFDGPFQLIHADVGNLEFLGKSATTPTYCCWLLTSVLQKITFILCVQERKYYKK